MEIRTRVTLIIAGVSVAAGTVLAVQAGAAPPSYTSLDQAASRPVGIGDPGVAESVRGSRPDIAPSQVLENISAARGGCNIFYGERGQCLPAVPPSQAEHVAAGHMEPHWACPEVRLTFKNGLALAKANVDPDGLDTNKDGTACGKGD
jgi:hypothetical protein